MKKYALDRTQFQILTANEADVQWNNHAATIWKERFAIMHYLNSIAYRYAGKDSVKMDRTVFHARKLSDGEYFLP